MFNITARTSSGRVKKPKAVFDPSDYVPLGVQPPLVRTKQEVKKSPQKPRIVERKQSIGSYSTYSSPDHKPKLSIISGSKNFEEAKKRRASVPSKFVKSKSNDVEPLTSVGIWNTRCYICKKLETKENTLISCNDCSNKIHKLCLSVDITDADLADACYLCIKCNKCELCHHKLQGDTRRNLVCCKCLKTYHRQCANSSAAAKGWECDDCKVDIVDVAQSSIGSLVPKEEVLDPISNGAEDDAMAITECAPIVKEGGFKKAVAAATPPKMSLVRSTDRVKISDIKKWSVNEVTAFIAKQFPNEAFQFKEHEINGEALLLLQRDDIINNLSLKLGPAMLLCEFVRKLQRHEPIVAKNVN